VIRTVEELLGELKRDILVRLGELAKCGYANTPEEIAFAVLAGTCFEESLEELPVLGVRKTDQLALYLVYHAWVLALMPPSLSFMNRPLFL
jgi:hypothetical protein